MATAVTHDGLVYLDLASSSTTATGTQTGVSYPAQRWGDGDHMDWGGGGWIMMIWMSVFWIAAIGLVAWAISGFVRHDRHTHPAPGDSALEIARQRYAKGEINAEEFEKLKKDLG